MTRTQMWTKRKFKKLTQLSWCYCKVIMSVTCISNCGNTEEEKEYGISATESSDILWQLRSYLRNVMHHMSPRQTMLSRRYWWPAVFKSHFLTHPRTRLKASFDVKKKKKKSGSLENITSWCSWFHLQKFKVEKCATLPRAFAPLVSGCICK